MLYDLLFLPQQDHAVPVEGRLIKLTWASVERKRLCVLLHMAVPLQKWEISQTWEWQEYDSQCYEELFSRYTFQQYSTFNNTKRHHYIIINMVNIFQTADIDPSRCNCLSSRCLATQQIHPYAILQPFYLPVCKIITCLHQTSFAPSSVSR